VELISEKKTHFIRMERKLQVQQVWDSTQGPFTLNVINGKHCKVTFWSYPNVLFDIPTGDVKDLNRAWPIVVNSKFHKTASTGEEVAICHVYANGKYGVTYARHSDEEPWLLHEKKLLQGVERCNNAIANSLCLFME
jgi:hypothetical protein